MTTEEFVAKRDAIERSLRFLVDECKDADDPFFYATAAQLLQIMSSLKLADPAYTVRMLDAMNTVSREEFGL